MIEETGLLKNGARPVRVIRQYSGKAGRLEYRQVTVFLTSASLRE